MTSLFGSELRKLRGKVSLPTLARALDVSAESLRLVEAGSRPPSQQVLLGLLKYFDVDPSSRPDILKSVNAKRVECNSRVREFQETAAVA